MAHILIVDDEAGLRTVIKRYAHFEGHEVTEAEDGQEAVELFKEKDIDLIIMDVMMPRMDGYTAVEKIREISNVPIIMLSARGEEYDKVLGFELGIDDYVVKPFSSKEIMMRVNAILRRSSNSRDGSPEDKAHEVFEKEGLRVDMTAYKVLVDGEEVAMAPKEYDLLFFLVRNKNIAVTREQILTAVWGYDYMGDDRTLDTHMKLLRKSIEPYGSYITTLRGLGYRLDD